MGNDDFGWRPPRHRDIRGTFGKIRGLGPPGMRRSSGLPPTPRPRMKPRSVIQPIVKRTPITNTEPNPPAGGPTRSSAEQRGWWTRTSKVSGGEQQATTSGRAPQGGLDRKMSDALMDFIEPSWALTGRPVDLDGKRFVELRLTRPGLPDVRVQAPSFREARLLLAEMVERDRKGSP